MRLFKGVPRLGNELDLVIVCAVRDWHPWRDDEIIIDLSKPPEILVLASMDRVVDVMRNHDDCIVHLLWSPDGKQLASVGYDETLTIWNFFGTSPTNECKKRKLQCEPPASSGSSRTDGRACGNAGGSWDASRIPCNRNKEATYRDLASSFLFKAMR
uniref:WD_REPEATS_REGION domain-containing protein n=1 Tax=Anopheles quadriannulatus TaxID=34691 RepID=A0A182WX62_ANOQN